MLTGRSIEFGIPKKGKVEKVDPYADLALLIMQKAPETKGGTYKFKLTKRACELLDVAKENGDDLKCVSFSFPKEGGILLANTTSIIGSIDPKSAYGVSMQGVFSNRNTYLFIAKTLELDNSEDVLFGLEFDRTDENIQDFPVATLKRFVLNGVVGNDGCNSGSGDITDTANEI